MKISTLIKVVAACSGLLILLTVLSTIFLNASFKDERSATARQAEFKQLGFDLVNASDYLTNEARLYSVTGDKVHYNNYMNEVNVTKTRDHVVERLTELGAPQQELDLIQKAKENSDTLTKTETEAFDAVDAKNMERARGLMYSADYDKVKSTITEPIDQFQTMMNNRAAAEAHAAKQQANQWLVITMVVLGLLAVFIVITMILLYIRILLPLRRLNGSIENLAGSEGDLTVRLSVKGKDEFGEIAASFNKMVIKLQSMLAQVVEGIATLTQSSREVSSSTSEIALGNQQQAVALEGVNGVFESIVAGIRSVAVSSEEAAAITSKAVHVAGDGGQVIQRTLDDMNHMSEKMKELSEKSNLIGEIVEMIDNIADQTNLLALNAAIEAARAGESGKGFAVVADEVRKLAERSGEATKRIVAHIKTIRQNTEDTAVAVKMSNEMAQRAGVAFKDIAELVKNSSNYITDIAASSEEQSVQSSEAYKMIQSMAAITEQTSAGAEENAAVAQNLSGLADRLQKLIGTFKV